MKKIALLPLIVPLLLQLACSFTFNAPSEEEQVKQALSGQQAIVFGNEEFTTGARGDLESYGMIVQTATDLKGAIALAGDGFVEFHCVDTADNTTIVHAYAPGNILWNGEDPITECVRGVIFIGFRTTDNPAVVAP